MKLKEADNLGFGTKVIGRHQRLLGKDGRYNVRTVGNNGMALYQDLVEMGWGKFFLLVVVFFVAVNALFACLLLLTGMDCLSGVRATALPGQFAEAWFFSVQTLTTVGYGSVSPTCWGSNVVASIISLTGLMTFALVTGLFFARFSRPKGQFAFSENAIISPYRAGANGLMFRIANRRDNQVIDAEAKVVMSWVESLPNGEPKRQFARLELELDKVAMLPLSWTIVHPIDEHSPLYGKHHDEMKNMQLEVIALIKGHDETFAQQVHANLSYCAEEIKYGYRFLPMYRPGEDGRTVLDIGKIDAMEPAKI